MTTDGNKATAQLALPFSSTPPLSSSDIPLPESLRIAIISSSVAIYALAFLALIYAFIYRQYPPIKAKHIPLMGAALIANALWWVGFMHAIGIILENTTWCAVWDVWVQFVAGIMLLLFVLNFRLYSLYHVFRRHRAISTKPSFWLGPTLAYVVPVLAVGVIAAALPEWTEYWDAQHGCRMTVGFKISMYAVAGTGLLVNGWLTFQLRNIRRSFNEFRELRAGFLMAVACIVVNSAVVMSGWSFTIPGKAVLATFNLFSGNFYFWLVLGPPVFGHIFKREETLEKFILNLELDGVVGSLPRTSGTTHNMSQRPASSLLSSVRQSRKFRSKQQRRPTLLSREVGSAMTDSIGTESDSHPRSWEDEAKSLGPTPSSLDIPSMGSYSGLVNTGSGPTLAGSVQTPEQLRVAMGTIQPLPHRQHRISSPLSPEGLLIPDTPSKAPSLPVFRAPPPPTHIPPSITTSTSFRQSFGPGKKPKPPTPPKGFSFLQRPSISEASLAERASDGSERVCSPAISAVGGGRWKSGANSPHSSPENDLSKPSLSVMVTRTPLVQVVPPSPMSSVHTRSQRVSLDVSHDQSSEEYFSFSSEHGGDDHGEFVASSYPAKSPLITKDSQAPPLPNQPPPLSVLPQDGSSLSSISTSIPKAVVSRSSVLYAIRSPSTTVVNRPKHTSSASNDFAMWSAVLSSRRPKSPITTRPVPMPIVLESNTAPIWSGSMSPPRGTPLLSFNTARTQPVADAEEAWWSGEREGYDA